MESKSRSTCQSCSSATKCLALPHITRGQQFTNPNCRRLSITVLHYGFDPRMQIEKHLSAPSAGAQDAPVLISDRDDTSQVASCRSSSSAQHHEFCTRSPSKMIYIDTSEDAAVARESCAGDAVVFRADQIRKWIYKLPGAFCKSLGLQKSLLTTSGIAQRQRRPRPLHK